jgi:hypothetical protein
MSIKLSGTSQHDGVPAGVTGRDRVVFLVGKAMVDRRGKPCGRGWPYLYLRFEGYLLGKHVGNDKAYRNWHDVTQRLYHFDH